MDPESDELKEIILNQSRELFADCNEPSELWVDDLKPKNPTTLLGRATWGALPPREEIPPMQIPSQAVSLTIDNNFGPCRTNEECVSKLKQVQKFFMDDMSMPDIPFNFIVGNDGNVYEGRGWQSKAQATVDTVTIKDDTVNIALLGGAVDGFSHVDGMDQRVQTAKDFVLEAIEKNLIVKEYGLTGYERKIKIE